MIAPSALDIRSSSNQSTSRPSPVSALTWRDQQRRGVSSINLESIHPDQPQLQKKHAGTPTNWHHSGLQSPYKQFSENDTKQKIAKSPEKNFETEKGKCQTV